MNIHAQLGPVTLAEMLNEWAERALMQPFMVEGEGKAGDVWIGGTRGKVSPRR